MYMNATIQTLTFNGELTRPNFQLEPDAPRNTDAKPLVFASDALCFRHAVPAGFSTGAGAPLRLDSVWLTRGLLELSQVELAALGRLLPILLCGEESAFQVFRREGRRLPNTQVRRTQALAYRIAAEELQHERLLQDLRSYCPVPDDLESIVARTRRFFLQMASRDPVLHFAVVAALDSGVCIILSALAKPLSRAAVVVEILNRIRSDEARHVRFSRQHSHELGGTTSLLADTAVRVRSELAALLQPLGNAFEDLRVDTDHLFRRVNAHKCLP
jgi:hypothetical protein